MREFHQSVNYKAALIYLASVSALVFLRWTPVHNFFAPYLYFPVAFFLVLPIGYALRNKKPTEVNVPWVLLVGFILSFVLVMLNGFLQDLFILRFYDPNTLQEIPLAETYVITSPFFSYDTLYMLLIAPICEELIFRRYLIGHFKWNRIFLAVTSCSLFVLFHAKHYNADHFLLVAKELGPISIALTVIYLKRGFWYAFSLHMFYNFWIRAGYDRLVLGIALCLLILCGLSLIVSLIYNRTTQCATLSRYS